MDQNAEEGPTYQTNSILTMKSNVKGNMGIKLKNALIRLKHILNSSSCHKE